MRLSTAAWVGTQASPPETAVFLEAVSRADKRHICRILAYDYVICETEDAR